MSTEAPTQIISASQAQALREAREILLTIARDARDAFVDGTNDRSAYAWGQVYAMAENAEKAIFDCLNTSRHSADQFAVVFEVTRP